jgi:hypothetical protein
LLQLVERVISEELRLQTIRECMEKVDVTPPESVMVAGTSKLLAAVLANRLK